MAGWGKSHKTQPGLRSPNRRADTVEITLFLSGELQTTFLACSLSSLPTSKRSARQSRCFQGTKKPSKNAFKRYGECIFNLNVFSYYQHPKFAISQKIPFSSPSYIFLSLWGMWHSRDILENKENKTKKRTPFALEWNLKIRVETALCQAWIWLKLCNMEMPTHRGFVRNKK